MRVRKRNNRKGGDVRDACTTLNLVATEEGERIFLAELGAAILDGTPITIGEKVYDRVPVEPPCRGDGEHRWVGGGDYGGSPPTICGDCGVDVEDVPEPDAAVVPVLTK
jgi:hypothetical protein